jgi:hypothetical protein
MTGQQFWNTGRDGDGTKVITLLSAQVAQSFINYQNTHRWTPLHIVVLNGHETVTTQLITANCDVDLQRNTLFLVTVR